MESILISIKKLIGFDKAYTQFDTDLIIHINSILMVLNQNGIGPDEGFAITGEMETWDDFIGSESNNLAGVKTYIYLKTKLIFDPPQSSALISAMKEEIKELEWRLNVQAETNV